MENLNNSLEFTKNELDFIYFIGVLNTSGMDGLSKEIERLKSIGKNPHDIILEARKQNEMYTETLTVEELIPDKEYKIGDTFKYNNVTLVVREGTNCGDCYFDTHIGCATFNCDDRSEGPDVIVEEI